MDSPYRPRKEPTQERARFTVNAILDAVARIVAEGEERLNTNLAAKRAGVSVGSLYQYFSSKEALLAALMRRVMRSRAAILEAEVARGGELPLLLLARRLVDALVDARRDTRLERALVFLFVRLRETDVVRALDAELMRIARDTLAGMAHRTRPVDPDIAAFLLVHSLRTVLTVAAVERPELLRNETFRDELARMMASYLAPGTAVPSAETP
jgi:AcrR family transcriptional regulator